MIKKILKTTLTLIKIIFKLCILLLAVFGIINLLPNTDKTFEGIDLCADDGGVWDKEYNLCRFDCQYTGSDDGCVLLTDEELEEYVNGYCQNEGKRLYRCKMARLEWSKRVLRDQMNNLKSQSELQETFQNSDEKSADNIIVEKKMRKMYLMNNGNIIKEYKISLGSNPIGAKQQENDGKTPEGQYVIETRNSNSKFHRSLKISYPNDEDKKWAKEHNVSAGGDIMIHGFPNLVPNFLFNYIHKSDWSQGCIAVTDEQIEEIWMLVKNGTPIEIRP